MAELVERNKAALLLIFHFSDRIAIVLQRFVFGKWVGGLGIFHRPQGRVNILNSIKVTKLGLNNYSPHISPMIHFFLIFGVRYFLDWYKESTVFKIQKERVLFYANFQLSFKTLAFKLQAFPELASLFWGNVVK